jgi:surfeit locus 1 family protein
MPIFSSLRNYLRPALILLLLLTCLAMAALQYWRAATRGERFEREQAALLSTPVSLSPQQRAREALIDRAAIARGRWLPAKTLFLDNKIHRSRPGYHVLTPLQLSGSEVVVLVNRGWVPAPRLRSELPLVVSAPGEVEVSGVTRSFETRIFELQETPPQGAVWQHVREADYRRHSGLDALPVLLLQTGANNDGMIRDWGSAENPAIKHHGYMAMWLVFAFMGAAYGLFAWRKK